MWIAWFVSRQSRDALITKMVQKRRALGVHFSYNGEVSFQKNFYDKITKIKKQIHQWSWRGLSLFGKVLIIKSLLLPKLVYIFMINQMM